MEMFLHVHLLPWSVVACACLLSLVVARGETGKFLRATADILMTSRQLASQNIQMVSEVGDDKCSMACDGHYLYIHNRGGLYKIGSGFGGTTKGHIYLHRPDFHPGEIGWLGFVHDDLLFRPIEGNQEMMVIDRELLKVTEVSQCSEKGWDRGLAFSDGSCIGNIIPDKEDGFLIKTYNPQVKPMPLISEMAISLAEKCIQACGGAEYQETLTTGLDEELFTTVERVPRLGMKHGTSAVPSAVSVQHNTNADHQNRDAGGSAIPAPISGPSASVSHPTKWPELIITKGPRIVHLAVGHEGLHAILVSDEGSAYFVGTARRGEDGDGNKIRRQPKAVKPKKMLKMEGNFVVNAACNNGTTALVTRDGELYMFGKDTFSCDQTCGLVTDLKDVHISAVALGKAHVVALTNKGHVYSFGINNKGQCGRDFAPHTKESTSESASVSMAGAVDEDCDEDEGNESGDDGGEWTMCPSGRHRWSRDHCMVCTICHECTGYGASCVSSGRPNRSPAMPCGCGSGDSGCIECGCCRTCADEVGEGDADGIPLMQMQPIGLLPEVGNVGGNFFGGAGRVQDPLMPRVDQKPMDEGLSSDQEKDTSKIVAISPARVQLPTTSPVIQIACGLHHSIALCSNGDVYTWGSNNYGQLGTGDLIAYGCPKLVRLPPTLRITQVAAGSNHSVLLTSNGQIFTFGSYQKGQLGRGAPQYDAGESSSRGRAPWYSLPSPIPGIGPRMGKRATWIGASADTTFIKLDQSLINAYNFQSSAVVANANCIVLLPVNRKGKKKDDNWRCLVISRSDGGCKSFSSDTQADFTGQTVCSDPIYNVIWSFDAGSQEVKCYNIISAKAKRLPKPNIRDGLRDVLSSALSLPVLSDFQVSRAQVMVVAGAIPLFDLGVEGGDQEADGEILAETEEVPYECGARQKFPLLFDEPVPIQANRWYAAWARVSGPSSDCGSSGQSMITTEDQVIFYFKSSKKSNNGTDVNAGQIPQILYRILSSESNLQSKLVLPEETVPILSKGFYINITNDVFQSLLDLLNWSWTTLCSCIGEQVTKSSSGTGGQMVAKLDLQRLVYVCCSCLRLLRVYINEIYPNSGDPNFYGKMMAVVLEECHNTFVSSFHAFYPTGQLKWSCLCDLLLSRDEGCEESHASDRLLSAVLASLCSPTVKLRATCPILTDHEAELAQRPSPADNAALSTLQPGDLYRYPILVEHMTYKIQAGNGVGMMWTFREVLDRLLGNELPTSGRVLHATPCRFTRMSQSRTWSTGNGSPDAICFSVDRHGIMIAGVCVYGGVGTYDYEVELMDEKGVNNPGGDGAHALERWTVIEVIRGTFGPDDSVMDIVEIKFERPIPIKEGTKYAIRLTNRGGRTSNGDGGQVSVKGPDGTNFVFSACSLSVNGTNQIRGQIPQIFVFQNTKEIAEHQARKSALTMVGSILRAATELMIMGLGIGDEMAVEVLSSAPIITILLPLLLAHIKPVAISDPRSAVAVIGLIQEILPHVAALNNLSLATQRSAIAETLEDCHSTTSHHYAWVESDHPYKPATVSNQRVTFSSSVQWMTLEFDPQCGTAQPEDCLQVYIPSASPQTKEDNQSSELSVNKDVSAVVTPEPNIPPHWPVMGRLSGNKNWPQQTIILPGNELIFSLETASDYVKDEKANTYGFRVLIIGYEWPPSPSDALRHLEKELAFLGGLCASSLIKKSLVLPPIPGEDSEEDMTAVEEVSMQVYNAHPSLLSKGFALSHPPTIHQTLDGIIPFSCHSNERLFLRDFVSCNGGTSGGRLARWLQPDSYVDVRACEVEVTAVPVSTAEEGSKGKLRRFSQHVPDNMTFGGHPQPTLDVPYQVSIKDKMPMTNYCFEELRYVSPAIRRPTENMLVRSNSDGSYSCNWTPGSTGWYSLCIKIDGYQLEKFWAPDSVLHPSLQSEQLGIVHVNGTIAFVDEVHNSDGVWLRLSLESIRQYCSESHSEAWCLQYNQHLGKTLLVPLDQPKTILDQVITDTITRRGGQAHHSGRPTAGGRQEVPQNCVYTVIKCGASGHNIKE
ncbi:E3 ubiquitin-protein ligase MYCBP2 [Armadillidium nasatum]|uniref:E3 ubiquitin-protein ligase MYCBP2 n=1 Tax=Armadillidium nasatum TaxID=96803 RepID=A0A5N5TBI5_9CRUS|nr:E3 ubiquitin-protein ligase MYCBP2 [Armadillidium nasatum]